MMSNFPKRMLAASLFAASLMTPVVSKASDPPPPPIPISAVNLEFTGVPIPIPPLGFYQTFKVNVSNNPPQSPKIRLTDFSVQYYDGLFGNDQATFRWGSAPGWRVTTNNLAGSAYYEALSADSGIAPGGHLDGFSVIPIGLDTLLTGALRLNSVSSTPISN